jgi:nucleotide-binding universal stress UspA family protein
MTGQLPQPPPQFTRILVPTDFSESSMAALELAAALARDQQGELLIVHVSPEPDEGAGAARIFDEDARALHRLLDETRPRDAQVALRHLALHGDDPAAAIVAAAQREEVDLIVIATHGRSGIRRLLLGSVAEAVVRTATCPVLTLKS